MNNIEVEQLKRDLKKYLKYADDKINEIHNLKETKLVELKNSIMKLKEEEDKKNKINEIQNCINNIFNRNVSVIKNNVSNSVISDRKPKILFISDVKGWAWWIKTEYLKKYLSDEFDIDLVCLIGSGSIASSKIDQSKYDLYFTYGFSYIDFLTRVPKNKKVTGITAHRSKNIILPKMQLAGYHHANSIMLLKELRDMGFKKSFYVPNGVDENLFKPINHIKKSGDLVVGHVGKKCSAKGHDEFILPAIKKCGVKSATNLRTWKDRVPHNEMPKIYNEMDVFVVASVEDGTPNPALEAAACGRPIISNAIGNMPNLIKDGYNGFIVPRKIDAYVEKINYFKNNRDELIRMGNNARKTIEEGWTWKIQSENYRRMFREIFGIQK